MHAYSEVSPSVYSGDCSEGSVQDYNSKEIAPVARRSGENKAVQNHGRTKYQSFWSPGNSIFLSKQKKKEHRRLTGIFRVLSSLTYCIKFRTFQKQRHYGKNKDLCCLVCRVIDIPKFEAWKHCRVQQTIWRHLTIQKMSSGDDLSEMQDGIFWILASVLTSSNIIGTLQ